MKKYIRFFMRNRKHDITLPFEQAERVMDSQTQLVKIFGPDGKWTGVTINKAEIISTDHDFDREKRDAWKENENRALPEPAFKPIDIRKYKPDFMKQIENE